MNSWGVIIKAYCTYIPENHMWESQHVWIMRKLMSTSSHLLTILQKPLERQKHLSYAYFTPNASFFFAALLLLLSLLPSSTLASACSQFTVSECTFPPEDIINQLTLPDTDGVGKQVPSKSSPKMLSSRKASSACFGWLRSKFLLWWVCEDGQLSHIFSLFEVWHLYLFAQQCQYVYGSEFFSYASSSTLYPCQ